MKEFREDYKNGKITYIELRSLFWEHASKEEIDNYLKVPMYDRPGFIKGLSQRELDAEFNKMFNI